MLNVECQFTSCIHHTTSLLSVYFWLGHMLHMLSCFTTTQIHTAINGQFIIVIQQEHTMVWLQLSYWCAFDCLVWICYVNSISDIYTVKQPLCISSVKFMWAMLYQHQMIGLRMTHTIVLQYKTQQNKLYLLTTLTVWCTLSCLCMVCCNIWQSQCTSCWSNITYVV